mmetsp:Transcript_28915/g.73842  ORF Transcript_28915/g.73842 Transcript_28915/m.73842 type:complete len:264 (-) Transcript_28915:486-1277(-)
MAAIAPQRVASAKPWGTRPSGPGGDCVPRISRLHSLDSSLTTRRALSPADVGTLGPLSCLPSRGRRGACAASAASVSGWMCRPRPSAKRMARSTRSGSSPTTVDGVLDRWCGGRRRTLLARSLPPPTKSSTSPVSGSYSSALMVKSRRHASRYALSSVGVRTNPLSCATSTVSPLAHVMRAVERCSVRTPRSLNRRGRSSVMDADVAMSTSLGGLPSMASRTHPPAMYALWPACFSLLMISMAACSCGSDLAAALVALKWGSL